MAKTTKQPAPKNYEDAERELHAIVEAIEAGEVGLDDSLTKYERGRYLLQFCRSVLERAEQQIELLGKDGEGQLTAKPFDDGIAKAGGDAENE